MGWTHSTFKIVGGKRKWDILTLVSQNCGQSGICNILMQTDIIKSFTVLGSEAVLEMLTVEYQRPNNRAAQFKAKSADRVAVCACTHAEETRIHIDPHTHSSFGLKLRGPEVRPPIFNCLHLENERSHPKTVKHFSMLPGIRNQDTASSGLSRNFETPCVGNRIAVENTDSNNHFFALKNNCVMSASTAFVCFHQMFHQFFGHHIHKNCWHSPVFTREDFNISNASTNFSSNPALLFFVADGVVAIVPPSSCKLSSLTPRWVTLDSSS